MTTHTSRQLAAFVVAGGFAAVANVGSRIVFNHWMPYAAAIVLAYIVGMIIAFSLDRLFVFKTTINPLHHQVLWFIAVNVAALLQTLIISLILVKLIFLRVGFHWYPETVAHAIGVVVPVITSFIGHKRLTFRES